MTSIHDMLAADLAATGLNTSDFAVSATYTPAGGDGLAVTILRVEAASEGSEAVDDARHRVQRCSVVIAAAAVAAPAVGDELTIDDLIWSVERIEASSTAFHRLEISRKVRQRQAGPQTRLEGP